MSDGADGRMFLGIRGAPLGAFRRWPSSARIFLLKSPD